MVQSDLSDGVDGSTIERAAAELELGDVSHVARAALEVAGECPVRVYGEQAAAIAAVRVAERRTGGSGIDVERACEPFDVGPEVVADAERVLVERLADPAPEDVCIRLRRAIVGVREVLAAADNGRAVAPRLPRSIADVDPALAALSGRSLEDVRVSALRAYARRLEADLEVARLGVDLYAAVYDA